mmetsp:Transcript_26848/g.37810  ORF Transcript_26848/g.37810 Transcript_26848/m.37810 type:complete len:834 (-) Transcript_26848:52-2553(-)
MRTFRYLVFWSVLFFTCYGTQNIPKLTLSRLYGTSQDDNSVYIAIDSSGDVVMAINSKGNFQNYQNFDSTLQTDDIYIMKVKTNGEPIWTVHLGTPQEDLCMEIFIDDQDNIYFAGSTNGDFNYTNAGDSDAIIGAISPDGNVLWEFQYGGAGTDQATAVIVDSVSGLVWASVRANSDINGSGGYGYFDAFLFSLTTYGEPLYFVPYGSAGNEVPTCLALFGTDIIMAGMTDGSLSAANPNGNYEIFTVRYDKDLNQILSASQIQSGGDDGVYSIALDEDGNMYLAGYATGVFQNQTVNGQSNVYADYLLVKTDINGTLLGFAMNGSEYDDLLAGVVRQGNYLYACGTNAKNIYNEPFYGGSDIFIIAFDLNLTQQWIITEGSANYDSASSLVMTPEGDIWVTGGTDGAFDGLHGYGAVDALLIYFSFPEDSDSSDLALILMITIPCAVAALLVIVVVAFVVVRKNKAARDRREEFSRLNRSFHGSYGSAMQDPVSNNSERSSSTIEYSNAKPSRVESVTDYAPIKGLSDSQEASYIHVIESASGWEINYTELQLGDKIGEGAFGVVYKGKWRKRRVAVKQLIINTENESDVNNFRKEAMLMRNLRPHKNILMYLGICTNPKYPFCIVTEYMANGNLWDMLQQPSFQFTNKLKVKVIKGIAEGMCHLAQEKIVHRDLAARNILLDETFEPRISDFGMSRMLAEREQANKTVSNVGPIRWMAPESLRHQLYSEKSDVWSFGVVMHEVIKQALPYDDLSPIQVATFVGSLQMKLPVIEGITGLSDVMKGCLEWEANDRPSFELICDELECVDVNESDEIVIVDRPRSRTLKRSVS